MCLGADYTNLAKAQHVKTQAGVFGGWRFLLLVAIRTSCEV